jgi:hypothetical protein
LNETIKLFFIEKAREQWKDDYGATSDEAIAVSVDQILEKYAYNTKTSLPIIRFALS